MTVESSVTPGSWERGLREMARELGVSRKTLLSAVVVEFSTLPKDKQLEVIGDYFTRLSDDYFLRK